MGAADNFWAMGDTGPCGPCSELHYDQGPEASESGHLDCRFPCDCGRYVEIWNLVFMQFERDPAGVMTPLPRPSIDTGAGLERLTAVLQGQRSNYATDLFQPLIAAAGTLAGVSYGGNERSDVSLRILADHARASTFLIHDGVTPSNEGRGYVLRKIIRRGLRHGRMLGIESAFLYSLAGLVADQMQDAYPDLRQSRERVAQVLRTEEERFAHTLALALRELEPALEAMKDGSLAGAEIFRLYDTFGLPLDVLREIAQERRFSLDEAGFERAMEEQRQRARKSWKGGDQASVAESYRELAAAGRTRFEGYETTHSAEATVRALLRGGAPVATVEAGSEVEAILDHTPFYAASGGQIGDQGIWNRDSGVAAEVLDTYAPVGGLTVHRIRARQPLAVGERVEATVDAERRDATRRNHTATHLLHAALRQVLGLHVKQAGSVVEPGRLRFDFTHFAPLTSDQLADIERLVNGEIRRNQAVTTDLLPLEQALATGAMALFGEKYHDSVRVVSIAGFSKELCGGTHCARTGDIGVFKIAYESSVASGVRRIEAVTGEAAFALFQNATERLQRLAALVRTQPVEVVEAVERVLEHEAQLGTENDRLRMKAAQAQATQGLGDKQRVVNGVAVLAARVDNLDRSQMRALVDELRAKQGEGVIVLAGLHQEKAAVVVAVSAGLAARLPAGKIIKALPGSTGGGRPELAEGGAKDPATLDAILEGAYQAVGAMTASA
jgi:alanyl-tRNA synthetase